MKKRGFTLVELLAVIVLLAIVTLISIPLITGVIETAQKGALKSSVHGIVEAANFYYQANMKDAESNYLLEFNNNKQIDSNPKLNYKGTIEHGKVLITTGNKTAICIDNGKWYAKKGLKDKEATVGDGTCDSISDNGIITVTNKCVDDINACNAEKEEILDELQEKEEELANTKSKIAEAIRSRGYEISNTATKEQLATGIQSISSGPLFKVNTVNPKNFVGKFTWRNKTETAQYTTNYIQIDKLDGSGYNEFEIATDTAKIVYGGGSDITFCNAYASNCSNLLRFSPYVIGILYDRTDTNETSTYTNTDRYSYLRTYKWNGTNWAAVSTISLTPIMYRSTDYINGSGKYTNYYGSAVEAPIQDANSHFATYLVTLSGQNDNGTTTMTYYTLLGYLSINKVSGAASYSVTSNSSANTDTYNYSTGAQSATVWNTTPDGIYKDVYNNTNHDTLTSTVYYTYVLSSAGAWTSKTVTVTDGETPVTDLTKYGYVADSGQKYWVVPTISLNPSSKTITTTLNYKEISGWGYDDLSFSKKTVSKTFNIGSALPNGKTVSGSMSRVGVPGSLAPGKYFLDYTTGDLYAIFKLNSGYLYVTGKLVETDQNNTSYKELSLRITGVRYSDTIYDGSNPTSTIKLNEPGNHYYVAREYMLAVK